MRARKWAKTHLDSPQVGLALENKTLVAHCDNDRGDDDEDDGGGELSGGDNKISTSLIPFSTFIARASLRGYCQTLCVAPRDYRQRNIGLILRPRNIAIQVGWGDDNKQKHTAFDSAFGKQLTRARVIPGSGLTWSRRFRYEIHLHSETVTECVSRHATLTWSRQSHYLSTGGFVVVVVVVWGSG